MHHQAALRPTAAYGQKRGTEQTKQVCNTNEDRKMFSVFVVDHVRNPLMLVCET